MKRLPKPTRRAVRPQGTRKSSWLRSCQRRPGIARDAAGRAAMTCRRAGDAPPPTNAPRRPAGNFSGGLGKNLLIKFQPEIHTVAGAMTATPKLLSELQDAMASGSGTRRGKNVRH